MAIKVGKKLEQLSDTEFLKRAVNELQKDQKAKGKKFKFDLEEREEMIRRKKQIS